MNKIQLGSMKNKMYNLKVITSGMCDSMVKHMNEWQKADADGIAGKWADSEAFKNLESALIKARDVERCLIDAMQNIDKEIENY